MNNSVPCELKYRNFLELNIIEVFVCDAYMKVPENLRKKIDPNFKKMIFVGYLSMSYRLLDPIINNIVISINVKFIEENKNLFVTDTIRESTPSKIDNTASYENIHDSSATNDQNLRRKRNIKSPTGLNDYYTY